MTRGKITGADLKKRMRDCAASPHELAAAAGVDITTVNDYMRDSRYPSASIVSALETLEAELENRMARARRHLLHSYQANYQVCRNPPGVQLPEMTAAEAEVFCAISHDPPKAGIPGEENGVNQSFAEWIDSVGSRITSFYRKAEIGAGGMVLQGEPGGGKTTAIRLLLTKPEHFGKFTPAVLPLPQLKTAERPREIAESVVHYLEDRHWSPELPDLWQFLEHEHRAHRLLYVFDGFDEISMEQRRILLARLREWKTPYLLAGRPTLPQVTVSLQLANVMYIAKLTERKIQDFLQFRARQLDERGQVEAARNVNNLMRRMTALKKEADDGADLDGVLAGIVPSGSAHFRRQFRADNHIIGLLATPATLNIVVDFVAKGKIQGIPSAEYLLDSYIEFLSDGWGGVRVGGVRSLDCQDALGNPESVSPDRTNFIRILSATAWLAVYTNYHQPNLSISVVRDRVVELLGSWAGVHNPDLHFKRAMEIGVDAQLLDREAYEQGVIRFSVSHELLLSYFAGRFIQLATVKEQSMGYLGKQVSPPISQWAFLASFKEMTLRPTLGVARDALFFYLTHCFRSNQVPFGDGGEYTTFLAASPRVSAEDAGVSREIVEKVLPGNKIVAWRTLVSKEIFDLNVTGTRLERELSELANWLRDTYTTTNFEYVFEAIFRACGNRLIEGYESEEEDRDEGWRFCKTFSDLRLWVNNVGCYERTKSYLMNGGEGASRDLWKLRRSVYKLRYFTGDMGNDMVSFLSEICALEATVCSLSVTKARLRDAQGLADMARGTARYLSQAVPTRDGGELCALDGKLNSISADNLDWLDAVNKAAMEEEITLRQWEARLSYAASASDFLHEYLKAPEVKFGNVEGFNLGIVVRRATDEWFRELADLCVAKLGGLQANQHESLQEVKILGLVMCIASSHHHRMFFLPHRYSLAELGLSEPKQEYCDNNSSMLKLLFKGAAKGVSNGDEAAEEENGGLRAGGEFQVYDYYVRAIWRLLHEDPITLIGV